MPSRPCTWRSPKNERFQPRRERPTSRLDADVHADHAALHLARKLAGRRTAAGEDDGSVAVVAAVDPVDRRRERLRPRDGKNGPKSSVRARFIPGVTRREWSADKEALRWNRLSSIPHDAGTLVGSALDRGKEPITGRAINDRPHFAVGRRIGGMKLERIGGVSQSVGHACRPRRCP